METHVLFFFAAILAGAINSVAGGGGLITFPLLALVLPPVAADATSSLGLLLAYPTAVWRTRGKLAEVPRRSVWILLVPSVLGGLLGALLLIWTDKRNFTFLVPWLIFGGTVLFVLEPRLSPGRAATSRVGALLPRLAVVATVVVFVVAIYGGYFGAGIGILMISALSLLGIGNIDLVVPLKNVLAGCLRGVAILVFVLEGAINWGYGIPMVFGGLLGGYVGGVFGNRVDGRILRGVVIVIGFGVAAYFFWNVYGAQITRIGGE